MWYAVILTGAPVHNGKKLLKGILLNAWTNICGLTTDLNFNLVFLLPR